MGDLAPAVRLHLHQAMAWSHEDALLPLVAEGLKDPAPEVALGAAQLLAARKDPSLTAPLLQALGSDSPELSKAAAVGLVANKESLKVEAFEEALKSPKAHVAAGALTVLGKMDRIFAARKVLPFVEDAREEVAAAAAESLVELEEKVSPAKVAPLLESKNAEVTERAEKVLNRLRAADLKDRYVALLPHAQLHTRLAAVKLLRLCAKVEPGNLLAEPAVAALIEVTKTPELAAEAAHTLRLMTREDAVGDSFSEWDRWWGNYREVQSRINEADGNYVKVKAWVESGEVRGKVKEAVALLERAIELYEEIQDKGYRTRNINIDNECNKISVLMRQVRTLLMEEGGD
jgi:hypothetical protein